MKLMAISIIIMFLLISIISVSAFEIDLGIEPTDLNAMVSDEESKKWTFMAYLDGDADDLEENVPLFINDMELVGSGPDVNVVVQADDRTMWGKQTRRYYIERDNNSNVISSPLADNDTSEKNMGDPQILSDFVGWAVENYPAHRYYLAIFDHGGGWVGLCCDQTSYDDGIGMEEFKTAMSNIDEYIGGKLDILIYEACNMGMIEVCYQIKDYVDISIASEKPMNKHYISFKRILQNLTDFPTNNSSEIAQKTVDACYNRNSSGVCHHRLFGVHMNKIEEITQAVDELAQSLINNMPVKKKLYEICAYSLVRLGDEMLSNPHDLYRISEKVLELVNDNDIRDKSQEVMHLINNTVIRPHESEYNHVESCLNGIAICFPLDKKLFNRFRRDYNGLDFEEDTRWGEFLQAYFETPLKTHRAILLGNIENVILRGSVAIFDSTSEGR